MIDSVFELLKMNPTVSIISLAVIILVVLFMFKEQFQEYLKRYIKNKYGLYSIEEVQQAITEVQAAPVTKGIVNPFGTRVIEKLTNK